MPRKFPMNGAVNGKTHEPKRCGAKNRQGNPCKRWAMPNGRCNLHGGKAGRPPTHGLYSVKYRQQLQDKIQHFMEWPADDLTAELALMRGILQDLLDKGVNSPDYNERAAIGMAVTNIRQLVDSIAKIRTMTALTGNEVQLLIAGMSAILTKYVPENKRPDAIAELRSFVFRD